MPATHFIINPVSNRGATLTLWQSARSKLLRAGLEFSEHFTSCSGEAITVTRETIGQGAGAVIAVGGDGTLNEVVNGYLDEAGGAINPQASIGILPSGTGSDFRRSIGLKTEEEAIQTILQSKTRFLDALQVEYRNRNGELASRFAINIISFGLGGEVVRYVNDWRGRLPAWIGGRTRFVAGALRALGHFKNKPITLVLDETQECKIQSNVIIVANGRFAGSGMMFAPHADLDDGLIDIIFADGASRFDIIKELPRIFQGAHLKNPKVKARRAGSVFITTNERLAVDIDGEAAGYAPAGVRALPRVIRFLG